MKKAWSKTQNRVRVDINHPYPANSFPKDWFVDIHFPTTSLGPFLGYTLKSGGEEGVGRGGVVRISGEGPKECEEGSGEEGGEEVWWGRVVRE